jgi:hypothetical protein
MNANEPGNERKWTQMNENEHKMNTVMNANEWTQMNANVRRKWRPQMNANEHSEEHKWT